MTATTTELARVRRARCPYCGRPVEWAERYPWIQTGLGILALAGALLVLALLAILTWKACANLLYDGGSRPVLFQPLEDWTRF
jgi:hypothetical protein